MRTTWHQMFSRRRWCRWLFPDWLHSLRLRSLPAIRTSTALTTTGLTRMLMLMLILTLTIRLWIQPAALPCRMAAVVALRAVCRLAPALGRSPPARTGKRSRSHTHTHMINTTTTITFTRSSSAPQRHWQRPRLPMRVWRHRGQREGGTRRQPRWWPPVQQRLRLL